MVSCIGFYRRGVKTLIYVLHGKVMVRTVTAGGGQSG